MTITKELIDATTILTNGRFLTRTASTTSSFQDCMVIKGGIIQYIGSASTPTITTYKDAGVSTQDLQDRYVLPGFIDGHMHFLMLGQSLQKLSLDGCKDLNEIRSRIKEFGEENPEKSRLLCRGWMHSMTNGEAKANMLEGLDEKNRPIFIDSKDLHSCWCNQAALDEMGVKYLKDPEGGSISRDEQGNPSGLLSEAAQLVIVWPHIAKVATMSEKTSALKAAIKAYHEVGYTGLVDMAMDENAWEAILALRKEKGELRMRVAAHWVIMPSTGEEARLKQVERAIELNKEFNKQTSPDLRIVGIKVICDGVIDACTAALREPYSNNGVSTDPIWNAEMLGPVVKKAAGAGLQCALHAIGDNAVKIAIDAIEQHAAIGKRHRIEHLELTSPEDAKRLGKLGITASIQPVHSDPAILRAWPKLLGPDRLGRAFAYKEFADGGAAVAIGSDSPTAPHAPIKNLYVATTRRSAREPGAGDAPVNEHFKIGLCEAVMAATQGAAYSCFADERVGSLEIGKKADFVVVDMEYEPGDLLKAEVKQTWFEGKMIYESQIS
ncbi:amidohydrolase 3 [Zopfia rhizophila CBS 207.26]|uniref:Amidohydrolase 3 n=1 Tax=Zopfia rhizophila CBS 207.26 TaxID=1314779 RepID=A0A6A6EP67_9PEZI|nr:amidohydrolase 3 [Zopfia rhizophila CBS 207.26]